MLIGPWNTSGTAVDAAPATEEKRNNIGKTAHSDRKRLIGPTTPPLGYNSGHETQTLGTLRIDLSDVYPSLQQSAVYLRCSGMTTPTPDRFIAV
jgi:hypothetical protein